MSQEPKDEYNKCWPRLECLKLAQSAESTFAGPDNAELYPEAAATLERAEDYADFISRGAEQNPTMADQSATAEKDLAPWLGSELFSEDASLPNLMSFSDALINLKYGRRVARAGWNGKDMQLALHLPGPSSLMGLPYIYMKTVQGDLVPWLASQTDLLAEDWHLV